MLVFGPYNALPPNNVMMVFNLSSSTQAVKRLPGLVVFPPTNLQNYNIDDANNAEKSFDTWYYNYVLNDPIACNSLMTVLTFLRDYGMIYICISDYNTDDSMSILNESFMKLIQTRYDIKYSIVNTQEDFMYIPDTGCDFMSVAGITNLDQDLSRMSQLSAEDQILRGNFNGY